MLVRIVIAFLLSCSFDASARADYERSRSSFLALSATERISIQWELTWTGYYIALTDGDFGRRTYEGIQRFQAANDFSADGVLTPAQRAVLSTLSAAIMRSVGFEFVEEPRSKLKIGVPTNLAPLRESAPRGVRWRSASEDFVVETTAMPYSELSFEGLYDRLSSVNPRRSISYRVIRDDFFVVTGTYAGRSFYSRMFQMPDATRGVTVTWAPRFSPQIDGVVLAVAGAVFDLDLPSPKPEARSVEDKVWLVVASRIHMPDAISLAREYAVTFEHTAVFKTTNGRYAISIGAADRLVASDVLTKLLRVHAIPADSYLSSGDKFVTRVWDAQAAAARSDGVPDDAEESELSSGSGFFITADGVMLTNAHVAGNCDRIVVQKHGPAELLQVDKTNDLALIKVREAGSLPYAAVQGKPLRIGSDVVVLGFPLADILGSTLNVTSGQVSSLSGVAGDTRFFQLTAPIQPGNSGGPVLDMTGRVVGIATGRLDDLKIAQSFGALPQNVNFAVRSEVLSAFLRSANVAFTVEESGSLVDRADIAELGARFTAQVMCVN